MPNTFKPVYATIKINNYNIKQTRKDSIKEKRLEKKNVWIKDSLDTG